MRYLPINAELFIQNRKKFAEKLKPGALAVFNSNDVMPTNGDGVMRFRQNSDLFYLCGIDQEDTILLLFPEAKSASHREILFIKETNERIKIWEGEKLSKDQARTISGIEKICWLSEFESIFKMLAVEAEYIYLNTNEHQRADTVVQTRDARFIEWCKSKYPLHKYERSAPVLQELRAVKSEEEIKLMRKAIEITGKAFERVLKFIKPGVYEFEIEAEITHEFIRNRSEGHAYAPIIASGARACILHYTENNQMCSEADMLLMDFGALYANYAADLTRCVPVNGHFNKRQREVYLAVLHIMDEAKKLLTPGRNLEQYHEQMVPVVQDALLSLGLLKKQDIENEPKDKPAYKKYFMHGLSHFLGLDVHDVGSKYFTFKKGMVFTCEPGIYIPEENMGIRLENNFLITDSIPEDLTAHIPLHPDDIEHKMNA
ncbi:MAG: aminopeptidase P N-terminal domain-containing protein [Cytophagaceae bacterium]|nr:aminopeptidase P N-terminal domain-containing protein [Cytophagaceae bacterium]MDW8455853.1 aminopeptidase P N-terminal domain-containing protein [Cytophagaceae bacterium]